MSRNEWVFGIWAVAMIAVIMTDNLWVNLAAIGFFLWMIVDMFLSHGRME